MKLLSDLQEKVSNQTNELNKFLGMFDQLVAQKTTLIKGIIDCDEYLDQKDQVSSVLSAIQLKSQVVTKTIYEDLLTTLVHEVKGYDEENHRVVFDGRFKSNKPWLDIEMENVDGNRRNVFLDKGGSIKSIVAMGLRFITVSKTSNRRILFFDEVDREINSRHAPNIAKMLHELSVKIGMQVVYISHHDPLNFDGYARIISLQRGSDGIVTDIISDSANKSSPEASEEVIDEMEGIGISYIRLQNLKQHKNSMIELGPNVTVITGDIDIGKSSILHAMDAVSKNKGRQGLIRDGADECRVEVGLEEGNVLSWTYKRTGSKKTKYNLTNEDNELIYTSDSGTVEPEWLQTYLGMGIHMGMDINISDQNNSSFILDSKVTGHGRADILSLGKESRQILRMIKIHNQKCEDLTKEKNRMVRELSTVKRKLDCFLLLHTALDNNSKHIDGIARTISGYNQKNSMGKLISLMERSISVKEILSNLPVQKIEMPVFNNNNDIGVAQKLSYQLKIKCALTRLSEIEKTEIPESNADSGNFIHNYEKSIMIHQSLLKLDLLSKTDEVINKTDFSIPMELKRKMVINDELSKSINDKLLEKSYIDNELINLRASDTYCDKCGMKIILSGKESSHEHV